MSYSYSSNGGQPNDWNGRPSQPIFQAPDPTPMSEDDTAYPDNYGHSTPEFFGTAGFGAQNNWQNEPVAARQDVHEDRSHTHPPPTQPLVGRQNQYPERRYRSESGTTFPRPSNPRQPSGPTNNQFLQPSANPYEVYNRPFFFCMILQLTPIRGRLQLFRTISRRMGSNNFTTLGHPLQLILATSIAFRRCTRLNTISTQTSIVVRQVLLPAAESIK